MGRPNLTEYSVVRFLAPVGHAPVCYNRRLLRESVWRVSMTGHTEEHRISLADAGGDSIIDEAADDDAVLPLRYDITSFGIDFDVEGLVRRLNDDDVTVPDWQRSYVWSIKQASSFIESLLFGLPVPGIFLGRDSDSGQLYVIDGQQRLKTLQFFYSGRFNEAHKASMIMPFKLTGVDSRFEGLTFKDLSDTSRRGAKQLTDPRNCRAARGSSRG